MVKLPAPASVPVAPLDWEHASRLVPARFKAADCFERVLEPEEAFLGTALLKLAELTAPAGSGDLRLMDPSQVLFGAGAGWINASFAIPRAARFSTTRQGAFYVGEEIATCIAEVRHHLEQDYRREGILETMDLDYRALALRVQGDLHDLRGKSKTRPPWSTVYDPDGYAASQAFAATLRDAGAQGHRAQQNDDRGEVLQVRLRNEDRFPSVIKKNGFDDPTAGPRPTAGHPQGRPPNKVVPPSKPVRRNNMDSSSHNGIRGRKCEAEVFMLFRHGP